MNSNTLFLPIFVALPLPLSVATLPLSMSVAALQCQLLLLVVFDCSCKSFCYAPIEDNLHILNLFDFFSSYKGYELHLYPFFFY